MAAWLSPGSRRRAGAASSPRIPLAADERISSRTAAGQIGYQRASARSWHRWDASGPDQVRLRDTLAAALDAGIGFFDTAEVDNAGPADCSQWQ